MAPEAIKNNTSLVDLDSGFDLYDMFSTLGSLKEFEIQEYIHYF